MRIDRERGKEGEGESFGELKIEKLNESWWGNMFAMGKENKEII